MLLDSRLLDFTILGFTAMFFAGMLAFEYHVIGLQQPAIPVPPEWKVFFDSLIYPIVVLLGVDLALKYKKVRNPRKFVKKHWIDIFMLVLIPVFFALKFFKVGLSLVKQLKTVKMGAKAIHKTKKVAQKD